MSQKDLVEAAVEFYLNARREQMQAGMRELLGQLDGSRAARVAMLAGMTREELEAAGGVEEDDQRWPGGQGPRYVSGLARSPAMSRTAGSRRLLFVTGSTTLACGLGRSFVRHGPAGKPPPRDRQRHRPFLRRRRACHRNPAPMSRKELD
jgi:hypothetical protein